MTCLPSSCRFALPLMTASLGWAAAAATARLGRGRLAATTGPGTALAAPVTRHRRTWYVLVLCAALVAKVGSSWCPCWCAATEASSNPQKRHAVISPANTADRIAHVNQFMPASNTLKNCRSRYRLERREYRRSPPATRRTPAACP